MRPQVAFEFNGPQHYGPTARYSSPHEAARQQARDYIKIGVCVTRGIHLVTVRPADLSLAGMQRKVADRLPLRDLSGHGELIAYLERVSRGRRKASGRPGGA